MSRELPDVERMRDAARVVIAERMRRWHADDRLQFHYSIREYTSMDLGEWLAWKRDSAVSNRLAYVWGRSTK